MTEETSNTYARLSTFCFVCDMVGYSERDCGVVYANSHKNISLSLCSLLETWVKLTANSGQF